ncbi:CrcB family protein [Paraburkholderia solisilvae]|uniref:Fluoride-specific ion channel FluC n=1 Tax=Paraburkholderia solisilvae TaxID=624376 RepID=A0A6J5EGE1_9BURK|nr:CrcB family protein [Paraburkholderia solisilvae]CAB3765313.1 Putative fluoride ion transporter CrcB [Paraburkholderia solisilvae]
MNPYLYVAVGGVVGSVGRYWIKHLAARAPGGSIAWRTILINIAGSFLIGFFSAVMLPDGAPAISADLRTLVMAGVCGGFAAVSFCLQTLELLRAGASTGLASNVLSSVVLCVAAVMLCIVAVVLGHALAVCIGARAATA